MVHTSSLAFPSETNQWKQFPLDAPQDYSKHERGDGRTEARGKERGDSRAILVAPVEHQEGVWFPKEILLVQLVSTELHHNWFLRGTKQHETWFTMMCTTCFHHKRCTEFRKFESILTLQLFSSSALTIIVPHFFPWMPLQQQHNMETVLRDHTVGLFGTSVSDYEGKQHLMARDKLTWNILKTRACGF